MGTFKIEIEIVTVGCHGCDREAVEGGSVAIPKEGCSCPDCQAARLAALARGMFSCSYPAPDGGVRAKLTHWPGTPHEVVDDLVERRRMKGSFRR